MGTPLDPIVKLFLPLLFGGCGKASVLKTELVAPESTKKVTGWLEIIKVNCGNFLYPSMLSYMVKFRMGVCAVILALDCV